MPTASSPARGELLGAVSAQAVTTGVVAALLGYASSVAVVLAGLQAVGATPTQAASGLLVLCLAMAALSVLLSASTRIPVAVVWTTPGVALLPSVAPVPGGYPAALGALAVAGLLVVLTGLVGPLARLLGRIPVELSSALLAGILLPFCLAPARAFDDEPVRAALLVLAWLLAVRFAPRYAAPAALAALVCVVVADLLSGRREAAADSLLPTFSATTPSFGLQALLAVALPVYLVTMAGQNLVGIAVLTAEGYRPPVRRLLVATGAASAAVAPLGAPPVNLAAITGALTAGPGAHPEPERRWVAAAAAGAAYVVLGLLSPLTVAAVAAADPGLVQAAAGLGLFATFAASTARALGDEARRIPSGVALLVTASGVSAGALGSAALGLVAGLVVLVVLGAGRPRPAP